MASYTLHSVSCSYCGKLIGNSHMPEKDQLPTICLGCGFLEKTVASVFAIVVVIEEIDYEGIELTDRPDTPNNEHIAMQAQKIDKRNRRKARIAADKIKKLIC